MLRRKRRPKPSRPSYQSWLPGTPSTTRLRELARAFRSCSFHGKHEPLVDLVGGRDGVGDVAAEDEEVAAREEERGRRAPSSTS